MAYYWGKVLVYTHEGGFFVKAPKRKAIACYSIIEAYTKTMDIATHYGLYIEFDDEKLFKLFRKINRIEVDNSEEYEVPAIKNPVAWYWAGG